MRYKSPIFIIGMPRSGTKLLRELINNSPAISFPPAESLILPHLLSKYHAVSGYLDEESLLHLYQDLRHSTFYENMKVESLTISQETFLDLNHPGVSLVAALANFLKYYAFSLKPNAIIWGDKSPYYRLHIPMLKSAFSESKFIHIIRDPRDFALSAKKAWNKSLLRSAELWKVQVANTSDFGKELGNDYLEIQYEDLIEHPQKILTIAYRFLGLEFSEEYLNLKTASENLGDTKGMKRIVKKNKYKYKEQLNAYQIKRISEITLPTASLFGYEIPETIEYKPLSKIEEKLLFIGDGFSTLLFHIKEKGLRKGIGYFYSLRRTRNV